MADLFRPIAATGIPVIDSLVGGGAWNTAELTYGFKAQDIDGNGVDDFTEGDWKDFYGEIFGQVSTFANLDFKEAPATQAVLVQRLDVGGGGESGGPGPGTTSIETAVGIDPTSVKGAADVVRLGTYSVTWLHEIGHSLGLKHTHGTDTGMPPLPGVVDPGDKGTGNLNSHLYSVMGYTHSFWGEDNPFTAEIDFNTDLNAQPGSFGAIDIAALQHMYGARAHNTADTVYRFSDDVDFNRGYTTIWDTGGTDTIAYQGTSAAKIDLRAATLEAEIGGGGWLSTSETLTGGFTIAHGVTIENARGDRGNDILIGNGLGNVLNGGAGADTMRGLAGNDIYYVDNAGDHVLEALGDGRDTVAASVSYALAAGQEIEALTTTNSAGTAKINLTGNEFGQTLRGNAGANALNGGGGADTMSGLGGDDYYYVDHARDRVVEAADQGFDTVAAKVSFALAAGQSIERMTTFNSAALGRVDLTGNELAQEVRGNADDNVLNGKAGADLLIGNGGADTFVFDTAFGPGNVDRIADFTVSTSAIHDTIRLAAKIVTALAPGDLAEAAFKDLSRAGAAPDADDRILYDRTTGALSYDADGSGSAAAVQFATLVNKVAISHHDFLIV